MASQGSSDAATDPAVIGDGAPEASPADPPGQRAAAGAEDAPAPEKHTAQADGRRHGRRGAVQPRFDELSMDEPTVRRLVLTLAGPSIVDNLLVTLVGMADMIMVGRLGADAIAAVGLSNQPMFFALASFMALNVGSTALVARLVGARDHTGANSAARQSMVLSAILGSVIGLIGFLWATPILGFMGAEPDAMLRGVPYLRIVVAGIPFNVVAMNLTSVMRGAGDTRTPMKIGIISNLVNVALNYVLIYGHLGFPRLEVAGAAYATFISHLVRCALVVGFLGTGRFVIALHLREDYRPRRETMVRIMRVGLPAAVEQFIMRGGQLFFVRIVASLGTVVYAAHQVAINVESLSFMPGWGFAAAATSLVGQGLGAKRPDWSERLARGAVKYAMVIAVVMGFLFFFFGYPIASLYTNLPAVAAASAMVLRLVALAQPFALTNFTLGGALRGAGDTRFTLLATVVGVWCIRLPLAYLLVVRGEMGLLGAWIGMTLDMCVRAGMVYARFASGRWKHIKV